MKDINKNKEDEIVVPGSALGRQPWARPAVSRLAQAGPVSS